MTIIEEINKHLTIDEVLKFVPDLKQQGHNYIGKCPTGHDSKSGTSFQVNTIDPTFNCFNCGVHGSYIHLVEIIQYGRSSSGQGGTDSFKATLKFLADKYSLNNDSDEYSQKEIVYDTIEWLVADYQNQLLTKASSLIEGVKNKYGLTKEFITRENWGYGAECPAKRALEFFTHEELLATGLFNKSDRSSTGLFHIYQSRLVIPYNNHGRIRYTIGRKTKLTKDWPNGKEAPKYFKQYIYRENRPYVSKSIQNEIVRCNRNFDQIIITEGITDYLVAKMHELNAVSAVTTSFKKDEYEKVVLFCKKFKTVYVANDNDENKAGQKGTERICEMLINAGINPFVVLLPRPTGKEKTDLAEFINKNGIESFRKVQKESVTYIEYLINDIPEDIDKSFLLDKLQVVIKLLARQPKEMVEIFILDKIKNRFKIASMKSLLKAIKDSVETIQQELPLKGNNEDKKSSDIFNDNSGDIKMISSGQDYKDGVLYYTITRPHQITDKNGIIRIINKPFLINSNKKIIEIQDGQIISDGFALNRRLSPDNKFECWEFKNSPYSIKSYITESIKINPEELFKKIYDLMGRHVHFQHDYQKSFLAVAVMTWPLYMIFNAIGYIHLWAEKRSGKTTVLEILQMLGFNSMLSSSMTDAAIFRSIEYYRPLLLIDEAENLNPSSKARELGQSEKLELLKSGYKKSGSATRCEGQANTVMTFHNYSPKVFAGTKNIDSVLADRIILIEMKRAQEAMTLEELIEAKIKPITDEIRNMTYFYAMQYAKDIENIYLNDLDNYKEMLSKHKVIFRAKELWTPYLCTALLIDRHNPKIRVFESLLKMADDEIVTKETFGGDSKSMEIIEQLYIWTKKVQSGDVISMNLFHEGDIYMRKGLTDHFIKCILKSDENEDDYKYVNYQNLKQALRKHNVIDKDCDLKSYRLGGRRGAALVLDKERMLKSLTTYKNNFDEDVLPDIQAYLGVKDKEDKEFSFEEEGID